MSDLGEMLRVNVERSRGDEHLRRRASERGGACEGLEEIREQAERRIRAGRTDLTFPLAPYQHYRFWSHDDGKTYSEPTLNEAGKQARCIHIHEREHHANDLWSRLAMWAHVEGLVAEFVSKEGGQDYVVFRAREVAPGARRPVLPLGEEPPRKRFMFGAWRGRPRT